MSVAGTRVRKRLFIGDVHGCADELEELLARCEYDPERHRVWFVGDLVNRGPDSLRVLRKAREIGAGAVLGNHDLHAIARWRGLRQERPRDTLEELFAAPDAGELLDWLSILPPLVTWDDIVMVHAGLHPAWPSPEEAANRIAAQLAGSRDPFAVSDLEWAVSVRNCASDGSRPDSDDGTPASGRYRPWDAWYDGARMVVFGHWSQRGKVVGERVRGLDTGCVWGGELTAWIAEENRFVSVPAHHPYQPLGVG